MINADKPHLWKQDIDTSVDLFNDWFMKFAPKAYRDTRQRTTEQVIKAIVLTDNLSKIDIEILKGHPEVLQILRMSTSPPLARDRLMGVAHVNKNLMLKMEEDGLVPKRMKIEDVDKQLTKVCDVVAELLDIDILPWVPLNRRPSSKQKERASTIIADRLCGAVANPIIRNAQEQRQLSLISGFLTERGYQQIKHARGIQLNEMPAGSFCLRMNVQAGEDKNIKIPIDVVIQPTKLMKGRLPILIEAKSAGDFTNVNKRRKEEATKIRQLKSAHGKNIQLILFLCGYFDAGYLGYEAAEGLDWVWEHRIDDLEKLGI